MRNYNHPVYDEINDFDEPIRLPKRLQNQHCPRCRNVFPGGHKRCTACGLDVVRAITAPETAEPWRGYERGVIECSSCTFATPDNDARNGKIQRCAQCAKILYIPSGLYHNVPNAKINFNTSYQRRSFLWEVNDRFGAFVTSIKKDKSKLFILIAVMVGLAALAGYFAINNKPAKVAEAPNPLLIYYTEALKINKDLKLAEQQFDLGSGGAPAASDYNDKSSLTNRNRFVRASDRMLKQIEGYLTDTQSMTDLVPIGAESHFAKLKTRLEEMQRYYARLKDGVDGKNEARWKEAFENQPRLKEAAISEEQALNQLQSIVLKQQETARTGS